jgi:predicted metal-dependent peptidase
MHVLEDVSIITKKLMLTEPFYGIFASSLNKLVNNQIETAGVSLKGINYELHINENFWNSLDSSNKKIGLIKHELLHICFNHLLDRSNYSDILLYNIAADLEINQYIDPNYYPANNLILLTSFPTLSLPKTAGTKKYYELLQNAKNSNISPELNNILNQGDIHNIWKNVLNGLSSMDKKLIKSQIDHQIKEIVNNIKSLSNIPNELKSYIDSLFKITPPSYDWKQYLRRYSSSSSKIFTKKTRRKLNKRYSENPALKIIVKKHILIGIDTSGSISNKDLIEFFNEIHHIYKTGYEITIAEGDSIIQNVYKYKGKTPEYVKGRGGTDMNPFIEYINTHKEYNNLIILTDGFIPNRVINTFKPVLVVVCSNGETIETMKEKNWNNIIKINQ